MTDAAVREERPALRLAKYAAVSIVSVVTGQVALVALFYFLHLGARAATIGSCIAGGIPSYQLNRRWVWSRGGRSTLHREVIPFWILTFAGLALSTWLAGYAASFARDHFDGRRIETLFVSGASFAAFGALWVLKFVVFNRYMFGSRESATS